MKTGSSVYSFSVVATLFFFFSKQEKCRQKKSSQVMSGQVRPGRVRSGQVRSGRVRLGQGRKGSAENLLPPTHIDASIRIDASICIDHRIDYVCIRELMMASRA